MVLVTPVRRFMGTEIGMETHQCSQRVRKEAGPTAGVQGSAGSPTYCSSSHSSRRPQYVSSRGIDDSCESAGSRTSCSSWASTAASPSTRPSTTAPSAGGTTRTSPRTCGPTGRSRGESGFRTTRRPGSAPWQVLCHCFTPSLVHCAQSSCCVRSTVGSTSFAPVSRLLFAGAVAVSDLHQGLPTPADAFIARAWDSPPVRSGHRHSSGEGCRA